MTPPPNETPWRSSPHACYVPPPPDSLSDDLSSLELCFEQRPMDPSLDPTFVDIVDLLDAMMAPPPTRIRSRKTKWNGYKALAATGHDICNWIMDNGFSQARSQACEFARLVVKHGGFIPTFKVQTSKKTFNPLATSSYVHRGLTLLSDHGLNSVAPYPGNPRDIMTILQELNLAFAHVCHPAVSADGHFVEYDKIRGSAGWRKILVLVSELSVCDDSTIASADPQMKKVSLYNLYNILIFHAKLVFGHPTDLIKRSKFFNDAAYVIAGKRITSVELEHNVLRTRMHDNDPRAHWKLAQKDPRMHFILNCGAQSCPPIVPLDVERSAEQLPVVTEQFIEKNCEIDLAAKRVILSRLWRWFRKDFTPGTESDLALLQWISKHASREKSAALNKLMNTEFKVKFAVYNWADNGDVSAKPDVRFMVIYDLSFAKTG